MQSGEPTPKKHKKHKKDRERDRERYDDGESSSSQVPPISTNARLKLILRVGGSSTPEHSDSPGPSLPHIFSVPYDDDSRQSSTSHSFSHVKKVKKKEKKRKKEKKHKHNKEKRRREREEALLLQVQSIASKIVGARPPPSIAIPLPMEIDKVEEPKTSPIIVSRKEVELIVTKSKLVEDEKSEPEKPIDIVKEPQRPHPHPPVVKRPMDNKALQKLLEYLARTLEKKDAQQFFAWPVTDKIAPGYSSIISNPMDFNTIRRKVDHAEYYTLNEFTEDFKLMCENAMIYNQPETIYFKSAKKLLQGGLKMLDPEKIRSLLPLIPSIRVLQEEQLGFQLLPDSIPTDGGEIREMMSLSEEDSQENICLDPKKSIHYVPPHPNDPADLCGAFTNDLTTEEVLHQARLAAREAAHRLATRKPNQKMGFLRQKQDGSTSLAILVPSNGNTPAMELPMSLGAFSGKVQNGTIAVHGQKEDRKNYQRAAKPLNYGSFSSFAPTRDTSFSSLNDEETSLVLATYGDEMSKDYAESLIEFTKGTDYTMRMVDEILDTLTQGQHSKTINVIEERKRMEAERVEALRRHEEFQKYFEQESNYLEKLGFPSVDPSTTVANSDSSATVKVEDISPQDINFEVLASLKDIGIETGFLNELKQNLNSSVDEKLSETANLLENLQKVQNQRYEQPLLPAAPYVQLPSENEVELANRVTENLLDMAKQANPCGISSVAGLHKAMGIDLNAFQFNSTATSERVNNDLPDEPRSVDQPTGIENAIVEAGPALKEPEPQPVLAPVQDVSLQQSATIEAQPMEIEVEGVECGDTEATTRNEQ